MNKKKYLIGSVVVAGACALFALSNLDISKISGSYSKKGLSAIQEQKADEAMEWMKARYIDETTGQPVSVEKLQEIQKQISKMKKTSDTLFFSFAAVAASTMLASRMNIQKLCARKATKVIANQTLRLRS